MANYSVYQFQNSVWITNQDNFQTEFIALQNFSFEIEQSTGTIQLVDSSLEKKVTSMLNTQLLDINLDPVGGVEASAIYLSGLIAPVGSVTLEAGAKIQLVDSLNEQVPVAPNTSNVATRGIILMGEDANGVLRRIRTEMDGRLISSASVVNPPNTNPIGDTQKSTVSSTDDSDTLIPLGETIVIQTLSAGAEGDVDGSAVELWQYTDITKTVGVLLGVLYVNGSNGALSINRGFVGDGSAIITMRRKRLAGGQKEIFGVWQGYY